jgi:hypothetical protein
VRVFDGSFLWYLGKPIMATAVMAAILWVCPTWNVFVLAGLGGAVYFTALFLIRGVPTKVSVLAEQDRI